MLKFCVLSLLIIISAGCGSAASPAIFEQRLLDEIDYDSSISVTNDWRLKAYQSDEKDLNILVVTGLPSQNITYKEISSSGRRKDPRVSEFTWSEAWEGQAQLRNITPDYFDEICEWIEDAGDWDPVASPLHWDDDWIQSVLKEENPYRRYEEIHEVWVVDSTLELEAVERDKIHAEQAFCLLGFPPVSFSFYPEHHEVGRGRLQVQIYDTLNRSFRAQKEIEIESSRRRIHSLGRDLLGYLTLGMFNFSSRATFLWIPLYATESTALIADVLDDMEGKNFEQGIEDLAKSARMSRPDTEPANLRVRALRGYIDSSQVVNVPFIVKNLGQGEARNVKVMIKPKSAQLADLVPKFIDLGNLGPTKSVDAEIRFRLPEDLRTDQIVLTLQADDESPQVFRKTRVRVLVE